MDVLENLLQFERDREDDTDEIDAIDNLNPVPPLATSARPNDAASSHHAAKPNEARSSY